MIKTLTKHFSTLKSTPLSNILLVCGNSPQTVVFIVDCVFDISDGGKKMQNISCHNHE